MNFVLRQLREYNFFFLMLVDQGYRDACFLLYLVKDSETNSKSCKLAGFYT